MSNQTMNNQEAYDLAYATVMYVNYSQQVFYDIETGEELRGGRGYPGTSEIIRRIEEGKCKRILDNPKKRREELHRKILDLLPADLMELKEGLDISPAAALVSLEALIRQDKVLRGNKKNGLHIYYRVD